MTQLAVALEFDWQNPLWFWLAGGAVAILSVGILFGYFSVRQASTRKLMLGVLKFAAIVLIALCLINPRWVKRSPQPGENIVALVVDNSSSLTTRGENGRSWGHQIDAAVRDAETPWQLRLAQDFEVRRFQFGGRPKPVSSFEGVQFDDTESHVGAAVVAVEERLTNQPLGAILLFTDGNSTKTDLETVLNTDVPVFPVIPSEEKLYADLSVESISVSQTDFEDAPITVLVKVKSANEAIKEVAAWLEPLDSVPSTAPLEESTANGEAELAPPASTGPAPQQITLDDNNRGTVKFELAPEEFGLLFYRFHMISPGEEEFIETPEKSREVTLVNNSRIFSVEHRSQPRRILYVSGRPNWEHKFVNRAVTHDHQLQLVSLIRIAKKEPKFDFRGRVGERSNPLFRGFKDEIDEEAEAYDQPVLIRLNTQNEEELRDGFPKTREELYRYDAIVLDDVESAFFSHDQQSLIERFVSERGGGLLMLGGPDSFRCGNWQRTTVGDALPVYLDQVPTGPNSSLRFNLTRDGWLQPWARLRSTEDEETQRIAAMPAFTSATAVKYAKPGARVLSQMHDEAANSFPALAVQSYGEGQTAAFLIGDSWRWELKRDNATESDFAKCWRQTLRWLVSDVPERATLEIQPDATRSSIQHLILRLKDKEFDPVENADVTFEVTNTKGEVIPYRAEPSVEETGRFDLTVYSSEPGPYRVTATAQLEEEVSPLIAEGGWVYDPLIEEFASTRVNRDQLEKIAEQSGGRVLALNGLPDFVNSLQQRDLPVMTTETTPLWHSPWLLLLAVSLLVAEWGLRRSWGLT
ncbi:MAG: hypothetical protein KDA88_15485 [Planctomycetaceae bacterium]|nr:hypothetical protein [Planctomycetaceae bacterium]